MASADLQDLYKHLEHVEHGNLYFAWYAQLRADGYHHREAITGTVERFSLDRKRWYQLRFPEKYPNPVAPESQM